MATYGRTRRRGLPRRAGGEPWPAAGEAAAVIEADIVVEDDVSGAAAATAETAAPIDAGAPAAAPPPAPVEGAAPADASRTVARPLRRGLPRVAGGVPWPPATAETASPRQDLAAASSAPPAAAPGAAAASETVAPAPAAPASPVSAPAAAASEAARPTPAEGSATALRRGLPRVVGGEPWPPAGSVRSARAEPEPAAERIPVPTPAADEPARTEPAAPAPVGASSPPASAPAGAPAPLVPAAAAGPRPPLPFTPTVFPGEAARTRLRAVAEGVAKTDAPEPKRIGPLTRPQWLGVVVGGGAGLLFAAAMAVFLVRWLLSLEFMAGFLARFPGEYHLPAGAEPGFPVWVQWQHFFNVFLIVLIIRSGLQVRTEKRPSVFWTPKWSKNGKGKISLALWFHQSLDVLWLVNGIVFVVLLFSTSHWMRIVPTSWEVFPNALSAALQYVSLDWPTENGWVNYNGLQQLMYFLTVFVAAPLAAITGARMSGLWPKKAKTLNRIYPIEWARAVHFPVMLYFVAFIIVHVALVFATGALRNLNHMYGGADVVNWAGFWIFVASLAIIAVGWIAARPLVLAPIAKLSGKVTSR